MRTKFTLPAANVPVMMPDGTVNPTWYEKLKIIEAFINLFGYIDFQRPTTPPAAPPAVTAIANNQVLIWDATQGQFKPGAN
ncbi:hypothetical protein [Bradyrhizobium arachidis]|uniref:Uncharacterized protein n=1 Tax=Bradyrhizobium arachidis TaxID=858423 RepID=A0AAE7TH32_9BRAD|nr:hypothetical protein [Bradyrhizobium arachidis]QOZ68887.1 hypothetical protein WN72_23080 [Bradyrhizobium arachidis]SFV19430.1 hypothetical protein SAMN05192541_15111 [Bradyrhizobium arachidis]